MVAGIAPPAGAERAAFAEYAPAMAVEPAPPMSGRNGKTGIAVPDKVPPGGNDAIGTAGGLLTTDFGLGFP